MLHLFLDDFVKTVRTLTDPETSAREARTVTYETSFDPAAFGQTGPRQYFPQILKRHREQYELVSDDVLKSIEGMQEALGRIQSNVASANEEAAEAFGRAARPTPNVTPPSGGKG